VEISAFSSWGTGAEACESAESSHTLGRASLLDLRLAAFRRKGWVGLGKNEAQICLRRFEIKRGFEPRCWAEGWHKAVCYTTDPKGCGWAAEPRWCAHTNTLVLCSPPHCLTTHIGRRGTHCVSSCNLCYFCVCVHTRASGEKEEGKKWEQKQTSPQEISTSGAMGKTIRFLSPQEGNFQYSSTKKLFWIPLCSAPRMEEAGVSWGHTLPSQLWAPVVAE